MSKEKNKPNILLIILDTHRADRMGCYGYHKNTTPTLDHFSRDTTLFKNAIAPAQWTIPSHASIFSGETPTTHLAIHSHDVLDDRFTTLAEHLSRIGYHTIGFCNNPLVGLINNGLRRGFDDFYNYCGTIPIVPSPNGNGMLYPLKRSWNGIRRLFNNFVVNPFQTKFSTSNKHLQAAMNPLFVSVWTRLMNYKGNTKLSIRDITQYIHQHSTGKTGQPYFIFVNMMETHLPYSPPKQFIRQFAPHYETDKAARHTIQNLNTDAMRWFIPMDEPFSQYESRTVKSLYDAEVAYQDHVMARLFEELDKPEHRSNTLVIVTADHGEMLGEHQLLGHGFGVYQELIKVPLLVRLPEQINYHQIDKPVSLTNLFHTILDSAGIETIQHENGSTLSTHEFSLISPDFQKSADDFVISEAYAPENALNIFKKFRPLHFENSNYRKTQRAIFQHNHKLIQIEDIHWELINLANDAYETNGGITAFESAEISHMVRWFDTFISEAKTRRLDKMVSKDILSETEDELLLQRLRDLGYIE